MPAVRLDAAILTLPTAGVLIGVAAGCLLLSVLALSPAAFAETVSEANVRDQDALYGTCFATAYDAAQLAGRPAQRVAGISVAFQGFGGSLLASVSYRLRYGTRFGFSGDCTPEPEGGFLCRACGGDQCASAGQTFRIRWQGGDTLELRNETTGLFAANTAGGRDRLAPGGPHRQFSLTRAAADACAP